MFIDSNFAFCCQTGLENFFNGLLGVVYRKVVLFAFDEGADRGSI